MSTIIWTNHALDRLQERRLPKSVAEKAFYHPDESYSGKQYGTTEYRKTISGRLITLIVKRDGGKHIVISAWCNPPFPGTFDEKKHRSWQAYTHSRGWKKVFLFFLRALRGW